MRSRMPTSSPGWPPRSTGRAVDVIVVGGGIAGTSAAAFLAEAGASVVLIERAGLASGASGANSGVVQHPFDPVLAALYHETVSLYRRLAEASPGFTFPAQPAGMLFVSASEDAARREGAVIAADFPALRTEVLGGEQLHALEPALAADLWACRVDIGYPVMPGASTYAYASLAERHGAEIRQGRMATLALDGDAVVGVRVGERVLPAGAVLAAAGPWTPALVDPTGRWRPIRPRWGVVVEAELAAPPRHVLEEAGIDESIGVPSEPAGEAGGIASTAGLAAPAPAAAMEQQIDFSLVPLPGASAVGSTFLTDEPEPAAWMEPILSRAARFVPTVAEAPIRGVRACARPQSVDGLPLIGPVPGRRGLFVCAGHGPWGISTGPASARRVVDLILGRGAGIPAELDPARFRAPAG